MGHVGFAIRIERLEAVRILLREAFDGIGSAAVGVSFAQNRVDGRTETDGVTCLKLALFIGLRIFRIVGKIVSMFLKFGDTLFELWNRSGDIREFDDIGFRFLHQFAECREVVRNTLIFTESFRKLGNYASSQ